VTNRCFLARSFERHHHVVLADGEKQRIGVRERAEDGEIGAAEIRGDGDFARRGANVEALHIGSGRLERHLPGGLAGEVRRNGHGDGKEHPAHRH